MNPEDELVDLRLRAQLDAFNQIAQDAQKQARAALNQPINQQLLQTLSGASSSAQANSITASPNSTPAQPVQAPYYGSAIAAQSSTSFPINGRPVVVGKLADNDDDDLPRSVGEAGERWRREMGIVELPPVGQRRGRKSPLAA